MKQSDLLTQVTGSGPVRRLELKVTINAQIQNVWEYITVSEKIENWWAGGIIEPREGGRFILEDGSEVNGTVKICYPPYIFEFSWNDAPENSGHPHLIDSSTKSTVRFDLTEIDENRTNLTFIQYLPPGEVVAASAGWHQIVGERLPGYIETGNIPEEGNRFSELKEIYSAAGIK